MSKKYQFLGDKSFRSRWGLHATAVAFFHLPYSKDEMVSTVLTCGEGQPYRLRLNSGTNVQTTGGANPKVIGQNLVDVGLPAGMEGRRAYLYLLGEGWRQHQRLPFHPVLYYSNKSSRSIYEDMGYNNSGNRHTFGDNNKPFIQTITMEIEFARAENNIEAGYTSVDQDCSFPFLYETNQNSEIQKVRANPNSLFHPAIPVNFEHVKGTRKKSFFWNVYVFYADLLWRLEEITKPYFWMSWEFVHELFGFPYKDDLPAFKYNFIKATKQVFELYPEAEKAVDFKSDKQQLRCSYAPPMVKPLEQPTPPPTSPDGEPAAAAMQIPVAKVA